MRTFRCLVLCLMLALFWVPTQAHAGVGVASMEFSPDGSKILVRGSVTLVLEAATGRVSFKYRSPSAVGLLSEFSADGQIVFARSVTGIAALDSSTGAELYSFFGDDESLGILSLASSPDGTLLVAGHSEGYGLLFDLSTEGTLVRRLAIGSYRASIVSVGWAPTSAAAYFATENGQVHLVDVLTGQKRASALRLGSVQAMRPARDGQSVLVASDVSNRGAYRSHLYELGPETLTVHARTKLPRTLETVTIAGNRIATCIREARDVQVRKGASPVARTLRLRAACHPIALSPDGRVLVSAIPEKRDVVIRAIDVRTQKTLWSIRRSPLRSGTD